MLEVSPKFSYHKKNTSSTINSGTAYKWNNLHMYRTSSNDMGKLSPVCYKRYNISSHRNQLRERML